MPDWDEPDYKTLGLGAALRAIPWGKLGDIDEWMQQDELERRMFKATLDDEIPVPARQWSQTSLSPTPRHGTDAIDRRPASR